MVVIIWQMLSASDLAPRQPKHESRFEFGSWWRDALNILITPVWPYASGTAKTDHTGVIVRAKGLILPPSCSYELQAPTTRDRRPDRTRLLQLWMHCGIFGRVVGVICGGFSSSSPTGWVWHEAAIGACFSWGWMTKQSAAIFQPVFFFLFFF